MELGAVVFIGGEIVFGQNDRLAGEAVAESVERDSAFAFRGDRAGGASCVPAVDGALWFLSEKGRGMRLSSWKHLDFFSRVAASEAADFNRDV